MGGGCGGWFGGCIMIVFRVIGCCSRLVLVKEVIPIEVEIEVELNDAGQCKD